MSDRLAGSSQNLGDSGRKSQQTTIAVEPASLSLGALIPGQVGRGSVTLRNNSREAAIIESVETSCECVHANASLKKIGPGATTSLAVEFDSSNEPEFRGNLSISLIGRDERGIALFQTSVSVEVQPVPPLKSRNDSGEIKKGLASR